MKKTAIMKNTILLFTLFISLTACSQPQKGNLTIAQCETGTGCKEIITKLNITEIAQKLKRPDLATAFTEESVLVIENCDFRDEKKLTLAQLHTQYGGTGSPKKITDFDIEKYLKEKGCLSLSCPNATKKMSFYINASGEDAFSGNGYFYLNLKAGEAYMPNEAFHQLYGSEAGDIIVDQFLRNGKMEQYMIAEGKKYRHSMPIGTNISVIGADAINEKRFKEEFKETGNTRKHLNTNSIETEYTGKDDEGTMISFWIVPVQNVCLPKGKFDAFGFYNLGYISVDRITYLVTEISGSGFQMKITGIADGSYSFNPAGYQYY